MKLLSLFDGEGGFPLAAVMNGIEPVAASEIEPYPIAITRSRFPKMKHLGDIEFWESVRKTWAKINGTTYKPFKDIARLEKWYYKLRNDGAEYKADGNSLAIPCAEYVIRRIAETVREEEKLSAEETI